MALNTTATPTAWGSLKIKMGPTGTSDAMCADASMVDLGYIKDDEFTLETEAGEVYEIKDINGKLLDKLKKEPSLTIGFSLIKLTEETRGKFWTLTEVAASEGVARKVKVTSLIQRTPQSVVFYNENQVGSETFEAAKCIVNMDLVYEKDKGFSGKCSIDLLWPDRASAELFQFGVVASASN
jgi:hypothetical protein